MKLAMRKIAARTRFVQGCGREYLGPQADTGGTTLEVLALGTGVGIIGLIVIILIVILILRIL
jgi:hypothetical protein